MAVKQPTLTSPSAWLRPREWAGGGVLLLSLHLAWLIWGREDVWERLWLSSLVTLIPALLVLWLVWQGASNRTTAWRWLALGLTVRLMGDGGRWVMAILHPAPTLLIPGVGICYGLAALLTAWGLWQYTHPLRTDTSRMRLGVDVILTSTAALTLLWLLILRPGLNSSIGEATFSMWLGLQMGWLPVLVVLNRFLLAEVSRFPPVLGGWGAGWLILTLSDQAYFGLWSQQAYLLGNPLDVVWNLGIITLGVAALVAGQPLTSRRLLSRWQRGWRYASSRLQNLLPLLLTLLLGWTVLIGYQIQGHVDRLGLWVTLWLTLGLIARQGLLIGETEFRQYAGLVYSIAEPAFICDRRGMLRLVNPAFCQAVGVEHEQDLLGTPLLEWFTPTTPLTAWVHTTLNEDNDDEMTWAGETQLLARDGRQIPVFLSLRRLLPTERERLALAGTAHDLSLQKAQQAALQAALEQIEADRAQLERLNADLERRVAEKTADLSAAYARLEAQNRALRELDRLKSEFVSLVSHELRAPLTNIKGGLELVLSKPARLPVTTREHLLLVQGEIERLSRFVETILDLSALEAGRLPLYPAPLDLQGVVQRLQRQLAHHPQVQRLVWQIPLNLPPVLADEQALGSILFHLIDNALKYAPQGEVRVEAQAQSGQMCLQVLDEGPGLAEDTLSLLFQPFYRAAASDAQETYGHGLGLYIVRRLVEAMGGQVQASNRPQGGACFRCTLPLAEIEPLPLEDAKDEA
ncbi:ATP-binding protein [uncultured Thermanaerothrix sp.]|uniref:sensor histidine kinase n=1 Tax=uncultured Thermanaerothrix sp. TaxID=1195149 RepID=UPI00260188F3|nr:ATP-binding protein [uncultured Thermanaerothrix sp.]